MSKVLSITERELLSRHHDDELSGSEREQARALLETCAEARVFVAALEELHLAVCTAEEELWKGARLPSAELVAELARTAAGAQESLEALAPLLERFHDGEADAVEGAFVAALINERRDVADYLATLDALSTDLKDLGGIFGANADFGGFWDKLEARLDAVAFDAEEHTVLLYRFHDDEISAEERAQVDAWIAAGQPEVKEILASLAELHVATNASVELAQEKVDLRGLWDRIEGRLDEQSISQEIPRDESSSKVVSLGEERAKRRMAIRSVFAIAAAVALVFMGALLGPKLMQNENVIIERTVVIVDSVEYAPGSSVMINGPIEAVNLEADEEDDAPMIIWLLDDDEEAAGSNGLFEQPI